MNFTKTWNLKKQMNGMENKTVSEFDKQLEKITNHTGFIAALDQSGGSTPKALANYGIKESAWSTEQEMFDLVQGCWRLHGCKKSQEILEWVQP